MINDVIAFGLFLFFVALAISLPEIDTMIADFSSASETAVTLGRTALFLIGTGFLFNRVNK